MKTWKKKMKDEKKRDCLCGRGTETSVEKMFYSSLFIIDPIDWLMPLLPSFSYSIIHLVIFSAFRMAKYKKIFSLIFFLLDTEMRPSFFFIQTFPIFCLFFAVVCLRRKAIMEFRPFFVWVSFVCCASQEWLWIGMTWKVTIIDKIKVRFPGKQVPKVRRRNNSIPGIFFIPFFVLSLKLMTKNWKGSNINQAGDYIWLMIPSRVIFLKSEYIKEGIELWVFFPF